MASMPNPLPKAISDSQPVPPSAWRRTLYNAPRKKRKKKNASVPTKFQRSAPALLADLMETIDAQLWQTIRGLQEASRLLEHMGQHMQENGGSTQAEVFLAKARELNRLSSQFQRIAVGNESLSAAN